MDGLSLRKDRSHRWVAEVDGEILERIPDESEDDYLTRAMKYAPPLSDKAKRVIRSAADEYWRAVDRREAAEREARPKRRRRTTDTD